MRYTTTLLLAASLALTGCATSIPDDMPDPGTTSRPDPGTPGPAQKLADLDGGSHSVAAYQTALDAWAARCTESPEKLAGYTYATVEDLRKNNVTDETEYSALTHLKDSTPAGMKTKCEDIAAAYLTLRESGGS
jgi:hypothetical protein